jgi:hypothetical protein
MDEEHSSKPINKTDNNIQQEIIKFKYTHSEPNTSNIKMNLDPENTFQGIKVMENDTYEYSPQRNL